MLLTSLNYLNYVNVTETSFGSGKTLSDFKNRLFENISLLFQTFVYFELRNESHLILRFSSVIIFWLESWKMVAHIPETNTTLFFENNKKIKNQNVHTISCFGFDLVSIFAVSIFQQFTITQEQQYGKRPSFLSLN